MGHILVEHLWGFRMSFIIEKKKFSCNNNKKNILQIKSIPNSYKVKFLDNNSLIGYIKNNSKNVILIDRLIKRKYFSNIKFPFPTYQIKAKENIKNINKSLDIINFFERNNITKLNKVLVIGGGILQDLGAFSCSMYKRGIPWVYIPTTLLGMTDSCVGGKTGLNYNNKKNMLALFSAPQEVIINLNFLETLSTRDYLSGLGEAFRLHITGGLEFIEKFEKSIDFAINRSKKHVKKIILDSLMIKKSVVEEDEFEKNFRRSMNYGHSIGHALESVTKFSFPHGMAVTIGICIENLIARDCYKLDENICNRLEIIAKKLIDKDALDSLEKVKNKNFSEILKSDKKTIGSTLKLAIPEGYGKMSFKNFTLDNNSNKKISTAINNFI